MSIAWTYLDKRAAAAAALKDYGRMQHIIENTDDEISAVYDKMTSLGSVVNDGMPHASNPKAGEDRIINGIDEIDVLKERYRQALEYMDWFKPAWDFLSDSDQYVLDSFYGDGNEYGSNVADCVSDHLGIERASVYRKKNRALEKLTTLLYGKL